MARILRRLGILAVALVVLSGTAYAFRRPLLEHIGRQLVHADETVKSDAVLVLAGGVFDREMQAATLHQAGYAPLVLMTRENESQAFAALRARGVHLETPLQLRRRVLLELGVPADAITVLEPVVRSTFDEARAARQWAEQHNARRLMVVTSSFHTARSRYVFLSVFEGTDVTVSFIPAAESDFHPETWWHRRDTLRDGIIEWQKTVFYRLRY